MGDGERRGREHRKRGEAQSTSGVRLSNASDLACNSDTRLPDIVRETNSAQEVHTCREDKFPRRNLSCDLALTSGGKESQASYHTMQVSIVTLSSMSLSNTHCLHSGPAAG